MSKLILDDISGTPNFYVKVNENSRRIEEAVENAVLRTGEGPNFMSADLDMNGFNILNQRNRVALDTFNWRGDWATETLYLMGDTVFIGGASYINLTEHTSDVFLDDFNLGYWDVVVQATGVLPDQTGEDGKFLRTNGITTEWVDVTTVADATGTASTLVSNLDATLHSVAKSGNYSELNNKPTIPAAQVNSDWNAASGVEQILNKPTIPAAQVNSDWNSVSGVSQILNKPSLSFVGLTGNETVAGIKTFSSQIIPSSTQGIKGTTTDDDVIAGGIGEYIRVVTASPITINGSVQTLISFTLPSGDWELSGVAMATSGASGTNTLNTIQVFMSTYSFRTLFAGTALTQIANNPIWAGPVPRHRSSRSVSGTVTMTAYGAVSAGSFTWTAEVQARRVR